jgi:transcriptional regulator with XRE-family HTH domain
MSSTVRRPYDQVDPRPAILVILQNPSLPGDTFRAMDDLTPNAVIAWNVRRLRREQGWTQAELADRLSERDDKPWTFSMVSDSATAGRADRDRQFTVNEVSVLARVFQVSVIALFVPDPMQLVRIGNGVYTREDYVDLVLQFPPETMPDGFERRLQNQYAVRNRESTDRLARSRPARSSDPGSELAQRLLQQFFHRDRGEHNGER